MKKSSPCRAVWLVSTVAILFIISLSISIYYLKSRDIQLYYDNASNSTLNSTNSEQECTCVDDTQSIAATLGLTGSISDCCCTFETLEDTNLHHVYPLLKVSGCIDIIVVLPYSRTNNTILISSLDIHSAILPPVNQIELLDTIAERTGITDFSLPEMFRSIEVQDINGGKSITVGIPDNSMLGKGCIWNSSAITPRKFKPTTVNVSNFRINIRFPNQELKKKCETKLQKFRADKFKEIKALSPELAANKDHWHNLFIDYLFTFPDVIEYLKNNPYTPVEWWTLFNRNLAKAAGTTCETTGEAVTLSQSPLWSELQ